MKHKKAFAIIVLTLSIFLLNNPAATAQDNFQLKLNTKKDLPASELKLKESSKPRFPFLIGAEFGPYKVFDSSDPDVNGLTVYLDINLAGHFWFLHFEYGKLFEKGKANADLLIAGFTITPVNERHHKIYVDFGGGIGMSKSAAGIFLSAEAKYLYAVTDFFGLSAGLKYLHSSTHILGLCLGIQIFEN